MNEAKAPAVYTAIAKVMEEIGKTGIAKDRDNTQQKYKFRGIDDVYNAIAPLLAKYQLIILPEVISREKSERVKQSDDGRGNSRESILFYVVVQVRFRLVCADDGSEVVVTMPGEAMDTGDKATNKAMSAAYKYMAMQTFCIPTEGDNDADATTHEIVTTRRDSPRQQPAEETATDDDAGRASKLKSAIRAARTNAAIDAVVKTELRFLHSLKTRNPRLYDSIQDEAANRRADIRADNELLDSAPQANGHDHGFEGFDTTERVEA